MDHQKASDQFTDYVDGTLPEAQKAELEAFRRAVGSLGKLKQAAPPTFLPSIQNQIFTRSRGRFFGRRWKLFGRVPFEWVSLAMIVAMLVYYIALMHGSPAGVRVAP